MNHVDLLLKPLACYCVATLANTWTTALINEISSVCCDLLFMQITDRCNWRVDKLRGYVPETRSCGCSSLAADWAWPDMFHHGILRTTFSAVSAQWPIGEESENQTEKDSKSKRARQRWIAIHYSLPSTLTYPSGVSWFFHSHSPYWPLLP